jgi:hypothetical protein
VLAAALGERAGIDGLEAQLVDQGRDELIGQLVVTPRPAGSRHAAVVLRLGLPRRCWRSLRARACSGMTSPSASAPAAVRQG